MSRDDIAIALEKAAEGLAEAAFALRASEAPAAGGPPSPAPVSGGGASVSAPAPATSYSPPPCCPEHGPDKRRPGKKGGFYCSFNKGTRDNPDWCDWRVSA